MEIMELLQRVHSGDQQALHAVIPLVYDELKKLAAGHLRREAKVRSLETTALVHEEFLRLPKGQHPSYENRSHFYGIATDPLKVQLIDIRYFGGMTGEESAAASISVHVVRRELRLAHAWLHRELAG
jgi:hypothetical protein